MAFLEFWISVRDSSLYECECVTYVSAIVAKVLKEVEMSIEGGREITKCAEAGEMSQIPCVVK